MLYSLDLIILKSDTIITGQVIKKKNIYKVKVSLLVGELDPVPEFLS